MQWIYSDGGRKAAGFKGRSGDCVCRSIAIVSGRPYLDVYRDLKAAAARERPRRGQRRSSVRNGVKTATIRRYLAEQGYVWVPTMHVGTGCRVHLRDDELPPGRLIVALSKHLTAVIDGVIFDTYDPSRAGTRCVYGYWYKLDA